MQLVICKSRRTADTSKAAFSKTMRGWFTLKRIRIFGAPLHIHWSAWVAAAILFGVLIRQPIHALVAVTSYFALILLHKAGHAFTARQLGYPALNIYVTAVHGLCEYAHPDTLKEQAIIAWGGVLAQLAVAVPLIARWAAFGYSSAARQASHMHATATHSTNASEHSVWNGFRLGCILVLAFQSANALADGGAGFPTWPALGELFVTIGSFALLYMLIWAAVIFTVSAIHIVVLIFLVKAIVKKDLRSKGLWWSVLALVMFYAAIGFVASDLPKETHSEFKAAPDTRARW